MLPDLPSELIRVALADLKACEADPDYRIYMNDWHVAATKNVFCEVCFAGAVMAKSLGSDKNDFLSPCDFTNGIDNKLYALNELRRGQVSQALRGMGLSKSDTMENRFSLDREMPHYQYNEDKFHEQMHVLANDLEKAML